MKVSYSWLASRFDEGLPRAEALADLFNAHAFEVEGMEETAGDMVLDIKVLPDRACYALCHRGIAREAAAISGARILPEERKAVPLDASVPTAPARVEDARLCPRYMARRMTGVRPVATPPWLRERLEAVGARSINTVVDATNFVMFDLGQPLHAFDADKVKGEIVVRKAVAGERIVVLDGREIELKDSDLVVADDLGPIAIAGVKGGKRAEVTVATTSIILEAANFDPVSVRKTSTRANLRNDSSKRFENGITPALAEEALERVSALIAELSPAAKAGPVTDAYPAPVAPWTVEVDPASMNAITGLSLSAGEMSEILAKIGCEVAERDGKLIVAPPLDRLDVKIPENVADEIARLYGYERLEPKPSPEVGPVPMDAAFYWTEKAKGVLVGLGFSEALLYTLVPKGAFEVAYPLASDKAALRERIAPKLSESLAANARNAELLGLEAIRMFEIGKVFPKEGERASICIGVAQVRKRKGVTSEASLRESLAALEAALGVALDAKVEVGPNGAVAEADFGSVVAKLGAPGTLADLGFAPLAAGERYKPFSQYPFMVRDVAVFVPASVSEEEVAGVVRGALSEAAAGLVVKGPDCFDRFEKDGRRSYAFRAVLQSFDRTLSDQEANAAMDAVHAALKGRGWEVR